MSDAQPLFAARLARPLIRPTARQWGLGLLGALLVLATVHAGGMAVDAWSAIRSPMGIDYGEGIVWQQAVLMTPQTMYRSGDGLPFIVFHYPPVYHLVTKAVAALMPGALIPDLLAAGRLVSALSSLALLPLLCGLVLLATPSEQRRRPVVLAAAAVAGLLVYAVGPVHFWGVLMRVDLLGLALGLAGLAVAMRAEGRFAGTVLALLLCLLAVFTKQTMLSFGLAVAALSVLRRPRPAVAAVLVVGGVGLGLVAWLEAVTAGGFLQNVVGYNINRFSLTAALWTVLKLGSTPLLVIAAYQAAAFLVAHYRRSGEEAAAGGMRAVLHSVGRLRTAPVVHWRIALVLTNMVFASLMLFTLFKQGGSSNYLLELCAIGCVALGLAIPLMVQADAGPGRHQRVALILAMLVVGVAMEPVLVVPNALDAEMLATDAELVARIAAADKPVASEEMVMLMRAGRRVTYEAAIVTELAHVGRWDETPLVEMIRNRGFAFMLTMDGRTEATSRHTPAVTAAMAEAYPQLRQIGPALWLHEAP